MRANLARLGSLFVGFCWCCFLPLSPLCSRLFVVLYRIRVHYYYSPCSISLRSPQEIPSPPPCLAILCPLPWSSHHDGCCDLLCKPTTHPPLRRICPGHDHGCRELVERNGWLHFEADAVPLRRLLGLGDSRVKNKEGRPSPRRFLRTIRVREATRARRYAWKLGPPRLLRVLHATAVRGCVK